MFFSEFHRNITSMFLLQWTQLTEYLLFCKEHTITIDFFESCLTSVKMNLQYHHDQINDYKKKLQVIVMSSSYCGTNTSFPLLLQPCYDRCDARNAGPVILRLSLTQITSSLTFSPPQNWGGNML